MRLAIILASLLALVFAPAAGTWNQYDSIDEVASWLAMRPVHARCLTEQESDEDFMIAQGAAAYVFQGEDHMTVAFPICNWFVALVRGDARQFSVPEVAFSVLVVTHEAGHLRNWRKATLNSDSEASTQRWALRHIYPVARRIGLSHDAAVLVLRYATLFHIRLPSEYHAPDCRLPYVDSGGVLRGCGA